MWIDEVRWIDAQTGENRGRSTQKGSQFDLERHWNLTGATSMDRERVNGPARVLDLRATLAEHSNGLAITADVIRHYFKTLLEKVGDVSSILCDDPSWQRLLIRTLTPDQEQSTVPMKVFPYFENARAAFQLVYLVRERLHVAVNTIYLHTPSADEANEGYLCTPNPEHGNGSAHGIFHRSNVVIGENWRLDDLADGQTGTTRVFFDPTMDNALDADLISLGYFIPTGHEEEARRIFFP